MESQTDTFQKAAQRYLERYAQENGIQALELQLNYWYQSDEGKAAKFMLAAGRRSVTLCEYGEGDQLVYLRLTGRGFGIIMVGPLTRDDNVNYAEVTILYVAQKLISLGYEDVLEQLRKKLIDIAFGQQSA